MQYGKSIDLSVNLLIAWSRLSARTCRARAEADTALARIARPVYLTRAGTLKRSPPALDTRAHTNLKARFNETCPSRRSDDSSRLGLLLGQLAVADRARDVSLARYDLLIPLRHVDRWLAIRGEKIA